MVSLTELVAFCDARTRRAEIKDFPGAENGLQLENDGRVTRLGAAVDANELTFQLAREAGVDALIVHHGLFWNAPVPLTGRHYRRLRLAFAANLAVYSSHLPLDAHPEIGNNALLARELGLEPERRFLPHEGEPIGLIARAGLAREALAARLRQRFPQPFRALEFGAPEVGSVALLTGSGRQALPYLKSVGVDTFITGELRQEHFTFAQEEGLNVYICGHYATEVFGVQALAAEAAAHFGLPWQFLDTGCPL